MEPVLTRAADTSERREQREWAFSYLNNSVVLNAIITHFLWSILYVMYNTYLRLLIWGRKRLMNFLSLWRLFFSFFQGMHGNALITFLDFQFIPRSQGLSTYWYDGNFDARGATRGLDQGPRIETGKLSGRMVTPLFHLGNNGCLL